MDTLEAAGWPAPVARLARIGVLPADSAEEALRKETLVLAASVMTALAVVWVLVYSILGLYWPAAIPFAIVLDGQREPFRSFAHVLSCDRIGQAGRPVPRSH